MPPVGLVVGPRNHWKGVNLRFVYFHRLFLFIDFHTQSSLLSLDMHCWRACYTIKHDIRVVIEEIIINGVISTTQISQSPQILLARFRLPGYKCGVVEPGYEDRFGGVYEHLKWNSSE